MVYIIYKHIFWETIKMKGKEAKSKKNIISYDEEGGFLFMKNWSPILRWFSILPAIIITYIAVNFLFLGSVLSVLARESYLLSLYVGAILAGIVYFAVIDVIAAAAPKKRVLTGVIFAVIFGVLIVIVFLFAMRGIFSMEIQSSLKTHYLIALAISFISNISGLFLGVSVVKSRQRNPQKIENSSMSIM